MSRVVCADSEYTPPRHLEWPTDRPTDGLDPQVIDQGESPNVPRHPLKRVSGCIRETFALAPSLTPSGLVEQRRKIKGSRYRPKADKELLLRTA